MNKKLRKECLYLGGRWYYIWNARWPTKSSENKNKKKKKKKEEK